MTDVQAQLSRMVARDQELIACPYPLFDDLREDPPVFNEDLDAWVITRYDDVRSVLHDTDTWSSLMPTGPARADSTFTSAMGELMGDPEMVEVLEQVMSDRRTAAVLLNADPPEHRRQRKSVNKAFRPSRIRAMEPLVQEVSDRLMADIAGKGSVEFVSAYAVALPMTIIAYALGVGDGDLATFKRWSDDIVMPVGNPNPTTEQVKGFLVSSKEFGDFFGELLEQRKADPQEDIISDVATAELDGQELTMAEKMSMLNQFLVAGNETTTKLITNIAKYLAERPELAAQATADRSLVEGIVEESLRYEAPVGGLYRTAKVDTDVSGAQIKAGEHVWILYAAANRDGDTFDCPNDFDPSRENVRDHLAFGHGEHFCIGASLARMEAVIATNAILDHMPNLRVSDTHEEAYEDSFVLRGLKTLQVEYDLVT